MSATLLTRLLAARNGRDTAARDCPPTRLFIGVSVALHRRVGVVACGLWPTRVGYQTATYCPSRRGLACDMARGDRPCRLAQCQNDVHTSCATPLKDTACVHQCYAHNKPLTNTPVR